MVPAGPVGQHAAVRRARHEVSAILKPLNKLSLVEYVDAWRHLKLYPHTITHESRQIIMHMCVLLAQRRLNL